MDGNEINYLCCFCNTKIISSNANPADINVLINIDKPKDQQYSQFFYCHIECFRDKLHEKVQYHFHLHNIND